MSRPPALLTKIRTCTLCKDQLPLAPKPILDFRKEAKVLLVGQAPGRRAHDSGIPWNDPSGDRLREWLGVTRETFYNPSFFAIVPMGFCYPGTGKSGDLPPRPECSQTWMKPILKSLPNIKVTLLIGAYSQSYFLKGSQNNVTANVRRWPEFANRYFPLPHPSPRNQLWVKKNPWFVGECLPALKSQIAHLLADAGKL